MTDEEKSEEYANACRGKIKDIHWQDVKYAVLYGLAEGRKENILKECANDCKIPEGCDVFVRYELLEKENARLSKMLEMAINEVLLCGKQMRVEHPSMIVWTEETFRAELEKRVENKK